VTGRIRALIVDDEPLARTHLRKLVAADAEIEVVGECGNGSDAVTMVRETNPDLVFLDIQMPELDGFGVVQALGSGPAPMIVFITAYDEYALKAFEVCALDYLLKPVDRKRFAATLARVKDRVRGGTSTDVVGKLAAWLEQQDRDSRRGDRLAVKTDGRVVFVKPEDIDWVEAMDDYAKLHVGTGSYVIRSTLTRLEQRLPARDFLRIHRSIIVNVHRIREVQPWFGGDFVVILTSGTQLTSGGRYRAQIQQLLERSS
jgi:two-component system LytT family response regulator